MFALLRGWLAWQASCDVPSGSVLGIDAACPGQMQNQGWQVADLRTSIAPACE